MFLFKLSAVVKSVVHELAKTLPVSVKLLSFTTVRISTTSVCFNFD